MVVVGVIVKDEQVDDTELHDAQRNLHASHGSSIASSRQPLDVDCTEKVPLLPS